MYFRISTELSCMIVCVFLIKKMSHCVLYILYFDFFLLIFLNFSCSDVVITPGYIIEHHKIVMTSVESNLVTISLKDSYNLSFRLAPRSSTNAKPQLPAYLTLPTDQGLNLSPPLCPSTAITDQQWVPKNLLIAQCFSLYTARSVS